MVGTNDIRLRWVLPDPSNERAVDPLGMGAQADQIADRLVPQLSVVTTRARYFSFLCWAVHESDGNALAIHRLEAELAVEEARRHKGEPPDTCPGVVGRSRAIRYLHEHNGKPPARPERLYKNTAFAAYRPAMRALGLLTPRRSPELSDHGKRLAANFAKARGRKPRCLGDISGWEKQELKKLLGLDYRAQADLPVTSKRRRDTFEEIKQPLQEGRDVVSVLERYARIGPHPSDVAMTLHHAYVWELLSSGLALAFSMLLRQCHMIPVVRSLRQGLGARLRRPALGPLSTTNPECGAQVVALLRAALNHNPRRLRLDPGPCQMAERLVTDRAPTEFMKQLVERHRTAKPENPWISLVGDRVQVLTPKKNLVLEVRPRTYRLDAYNQLLRDLGMIQ